MLANIDIRTEIIRAGLKLWEVAAEYGYTDGNFSRKLRVELPANEKAKIYAIIEKLKGAE